MSKKIFLLIIVIIILIPITITTYQNTQVILNINGEEITVYKDTKDINLTSYNTNIPLTITKKSKFLTTTIENQKIKYHETISLGYQELTSSNTKEIKITYLSGSERTITLHLLPQTLSEIEATGSSVYAGNYYTTTLKDTSTIFNYLLVYDTHGKLIFYKRIDHHILNFQKHYNSNNQTRYTYLEEENTNEYKLIVLDENMQTIDEIGYIRNEETTFLKSTNYIYLDDYHYILSTYQDSKITISKDKYQLLQDTLYLSDYCFEEIKDNKVLWEDKTSNHSSLYNLVSNKNILYEKYPNYTNPVSLIIDESDNNLIIAFNNLNTIIKFNRENQKIIWYLGGKKDKFKLNSKQQFQNIQDISYISPNNYLIYDNNRIINLQINPQTKRVTKYTTYILDDNTNNGHISYIANSNTYLVQYTKDSETYLKEINMTTKVSNFSLISSFSLSNIAKSD